MHIPFKKLHPNARPPTRAHDTDAGYDLYSVTPDFRLFPGEWTVIDTGIAMAIPVGFYGRCAPRSGLAVRSALDTLAGVIDAGYRNSIGVVLINHGHDPLWIRTGDRVAQLIIERCYEAEFGDVGDGELEQSSRSANGFGSSGT